MMPIAMQPEPDGFDERVRQPGNEFLAATPNPTQANWKNRSYWRRVQADLVHAYSSVCAYGCHWIPPDVGNATIDHYLPKSVHPELAYEWSNYRLAAGKLNTRKGNHLDVLDPFEIKEGTFTLIFPAMLIKPGVQLTAAEKARVSRTITRLKLNADETLVASRLRWLLDYCDGHITFDYLQNRAPFIAFELRRQGLTEAICHMLRRRRLA